MPVVSDSDVIIHLAKLDKLDLLEELYGEVGIPRYIKGEIVSCQYSEVEVIKDAINRGSLKVYETDKNKAKDIVKRHGIHIGEAHVKELGANLHAGIFLSNERKVRLAAVAENFTVVGTIGTILRATNQGFLSGEKAVKLVKKLKASEFRIHPNIVDSAINSLGRINP